MNIILRVFIYSCFIIVTSSATLFAAGDFDPNRPLWLRCPAISPNGASIAFTYSGQIWRVPSEGGEAVPLTSGEFYSTRPTWSPDGRTIAFASNVHGNLDIYTMAADGGDIKRLTFHSADDIPYAFSPDGALIYFGSSRLGNENTILTGTYQKSEQLYTVPARGGRTRLLLPTPAIDVSVDLTGKTLLFETRPIYENPWRKGSVSDGTRDIWRYDLEQESFEQQTVYRGEDRNAIWARGGKKFYYLSERSGSFNIWQREIGGDTKPLQITTHDVQPVRFLSSAENGTLAYGLGGEIYILSPDHEVSRRVPVTIRQSSLVQGNFSVNAGEYTSELVVGHDGASFAVIARGEIFVTSVSNKRTRRITNTAVHERFVSFAPDGRGLLYVSDRDGDMDIFEARIDDKNATTLADPGAITHRKIFEAEGDQLYPAYSPDGTKIAFLNNRETLDIFTVADGSRKTVAPQGQFYSYQDGDIGFSWSPDSRWIALTAGSIVANRDISLVDSEGDKEPITVSRNGFNEMSPSFTPDGRAILFLSGRKGLRMADSNTGQVDLYITYLTREAYDDARKVQFDLGKDKSTPTTETDNQAVDPVVPQENGLNERTRRLTPFSISALDYSVKADGSGVVFLNRLSNGTVNGYLVNPATGSISPLFSEAGAPFYKFDSTGANVFTLVGPSSLKITNLATKSAKVVPFSSNMVLNPRGELIYWFNYFWRMTYQKFYQKDMHGIDWPAVRARYEPQLTHIHTWEDFTELMSEMAGELNASHMGCYWLKESPFADATGSLGLYYDETHESAGMKVGSVLPAGPADLTDSPLTAGSIILAINGEAIESDKSIYPSLNHTAGQPIKITVQPADRDTTPVEMTIVPISQKDAKDLVYRHWVENRAALVDKLSGGRLGYVHIPGMLTQYYQRVYGRVIGDLRNKEAVVIDVRYNIGGNLHDQLISLFTGKSLSAFVDRNGNVVGSMPIGRWSKPSALIANAGSYSDGSIFPHLYKSYNIGPLIGTRVPGTGTAVWWMLEMNGNLKWGIPQIGAKDNATGWFENQETTPDVLIYNHPVAVSEGRDPQLEGAVTRLLESL